MSGWNVINLVGLALQSGVDAMSQVATSFIVGTQSDTLPVAPTREENTKQQLKNDLQSTISRIKGEIKVLRSDSDFEKAKHSDDPVIVYAEKCEQFLEDVLPWVDNPPRELVNINEFIDDALTILYLEANDYLDAKKFIALKGVQSGIHAEYTPNVGSTSKLYVVG